MDGKTRFGGSAARSEDRATAAWCGSRRPTARTAREGDEQHTRASSKVTTTRGRRSNPTRSDQVGIAMAPRFAKPMGWSSVIGAATQGRHTERGVGSGAGPLVSCSHTPQTKIEGAVRTVTCVARRKETERAWEMRFLQRKT